LYCHARNGFKPKAFISSTTGSLLRLRRIPYQPSLSNPVRAWTIARTDTLFFAAHRDKV
jgi:hypothetical protein